MKVKFDFPFWMGAVADMADAKQSLTEVFKHV